MTQLSEETKQIRSVQFITLGEQERIPAPLVRVTTCGLPTIEIVSEIVETDPPMARYTALTPEQHRGRGTVPALMLLKLLLSCHERFATRDWLMEAFSHDGELFSSVRLDNIVSQLRGLLCPPAYQVLRKQLVAHVRGGNGDGYQLALFPLMWVDQDALTWNVEQAVRMERFGENGLLFWERAYEVARRGPYLPDERYSEWASFRRTQIAGMYRQSVLALARLYLERHGAAGEDEALLLLRNYWQEHPQEEDVLRPLMELLGRMERFQEALACYDRLQTLLEEEGHQPDSHTQDIALFLQNKQLVRHYAPLESGAEATSLSLLPPLPIVEALPAPAHLEPLCLSWGEAPANDQFYGRERELAALTTWVGEPHCRVIALCGMGGIGKTSLAIQFAQQIKGAFEYVIWRSLQHAPLFPHLLQECLALFPEHQQTSPLQTTDLAIELLLGYLRTHRCLLIFDNCETILQGGKDAGSYREGYEDYQLFFQRVGETGHRSCVLLTSREKPKGLSHLEGNGRAVHLLYLSGVSVSEGKAILREKGLVGPDEAWGTLIQLYAGNPLALQLIAEPIQALFAADIAAFLDEGGTVIGDITDLLEQQFHRLSAPEKEVLYWLAIEREAVALEALWKNMVPSPPKKTLLTLLMSLRQRSLIETTTIGDFTLQPVIMEYVTDALVTCMSEEIHTENLSLFASHALMKAQAEEYVRETQLRFILTPLAERLLVMLGREGLEHQCTHILHALRATHLLATGYAAGNILNLLLQQGYDLHGFDFSHLTIRQAYLQGFSLADVSFAHAQLSACVFTDTFGSALTLAFSPSGKRLAAGSSNSEVRIWSTQGLTPLRINRGHTNGIRSVAFSPDEAVLASGSEDHTIRLWEAESGQWLRTLEGHGDRVHSVAFSPDGTMLASGSEDQTVRLWHVEHGHCLGIFEGHTGSVRTVAFHPGGTMLASGSEDRSIRVWEVSSGRCLNTLTGHNAAVSLVVFHPDEPILTSTSEDQTVRTWEVSSGHCLKVLEQREKSLAITSTPHKALLASSQDQALRVWDIERGQRVQTLAGHTSWVRAAAFNPNGAILASSSEDTNVRIWEVGSGQCLRILQGYAHQVWTVAFHCEGQFLASGGEDHIVRIWDTNNGRCLHTLPGHTSRVRSVVFSPDGSILLSGSEDQTIRLWESHSGRCLRVLQGHTDWIYTIAVHANGELLASGGENRDIHLWNMKTGQQLALFQGHRNRVRSVVFSPDGRTVASGSEDQTVRIWDVHTGQCLRVFQGHTDRVYSVAFHPDGQFLASSSDDQTIRLWDIQTGQSLNVLRGHTDRIRSVVFNADGTVLTSGSSDQTVQMWDVQTGQCLHMLQGHTDHVRAVAFRPDNQILASGSHDGTIRLWDARSGASLQILRSDRPYERLRIAGASGLTEAQKATLFSLGATLDNPEPQG